MTIRCRETLEDLVFPTSPQDMHSPAPPPSLRDFRARILKVWNLQLGRRISKHAPKFQHYSRYRLRAGVLAAPSRRLLGRGRNAVSSWERGLTLPSVPKLLRMAKLLGTLAEGLYWDSTRPHPARVAMTYRHAWGFAPACSARAHQPPPGLSLAREETLLAALDCDRGALAAALRELELVGRSGRSSAPVSSSPACAHGSYCISQRFP